jgi:hypothetical protein
MAMVRAIVDGARIKPPLSPTLHLELFQAATLWLGGHLQRDPDVVGADIAEFMWRVQFREDLESAPMQLLRLQELGEFQGTQAEAVAHAVAYSIGSANTNARPMSYTEQWPETIGPFMFDELSALWPKIPPSKKDVLTAFEGLSSVDLAVRLVNRARQLDLS